MTGAAEPWRVRADCRLCGGAKLEVVLELQPTPPANEFVRAGDAPQELIPLHLARCASCGHVQLPVVVDPDRLFREYVYVSGTSSSFVAHLHSYAAAVAERVRLCPQDLVVEIGSNDGTMLRAFRSLGLRVLGVDPAIEIAARATAAGLPTLPRFFDRAVAANVRWEHGEAALVVANNVFAHVDDLREIALGVRDLLAPARGCFAFEVQYLVDMVRGGLFDMIYHEHLSYHSLAPLARFFDSLGMSLVDAERVLTHGGSVRCFVAPVRGVSKSDRLQDLLAEEAIVLAPEADPFGLMRRIATRARLDLRDFLDREQRAGHVVAGYGAPAKMTTLCHEFEIDARDVAYVVDDSPWKQGLLAPGTRIPVVAPFSRPCAPETFVVFAWNFAGPIAKSLRASGYKGKIVVPLPELKELP